MKQRDYWTIALKNIRRQPLRSGLTLCALVLSTAIVMTMAGLSIGGYQSTYSQFGSSASLRTVTVTQSQASNALGPFGDVTETGAQKHLDDQTVQQLAQIANVTKASPRAGLWELASFTVAGFSPKFNVQAVGVPNDSSLPLAAGVDFNVK